MNAPFVVVYRWRVHQEKDAQFRDAWRELTQRIRRFRGSAGSRLHRDEEGHYVAIALWPSRAAWEATTPDLPDGDEYIGRLRDSIAESFPAQLLTVVDDQWAAERD